MNIDELNKVRLEDWFYEFSLPDGTLTTPDIGKDVQKIHITRRDKLREVIINEVTNPELLTALDFASHQGYFTIELSRYFKEVLGLELRAESIEQAKLISSVLSVSNVSYKQCDLLDLNLIEIPKADFVLVYGLLYHLEDPIKILRVASELSKQHILIETQIFPYDISGKIEDGSYNWQRSVAGIFSLSVDYKERREGGSTDLALVPSLNALLFLLDHFGFKKVRVIDTTQDDYEQFVRGSRVIIYGSK